MKFFIFSFSFFMFFSIQSMQAQNSREMDEAAMIFANGMCECVNPHLSGMDDDVINALSQMPLEGGEDAIEEYFTRLDEDLLLRLVEQVTMVEDLAETQEFNDCFMQLETKLARFEGVLENMESEEAFFERVMDDLETSSECQLTYVFMKIGLGE